MRGQKEHFQTKEYQKIKSINYPSYGRGLANPGMELNTFMIRQDMCEDIKEKNKQRKRVTSNSPGSPGDKSPKKARILSPKRMKFEKRFKNYLEKKFVTDQLPEAPAPNMDFDTTTKPEGTFNAKVNERERWLERERLRKELLNQKKTLPTLEKDAEEVLAEEVVVHLGQEMYTKLREVFDLVRAREKIDGEEIET